MTWCCRQEQSRSNSSATPVRFGFGFTTLRRRSPCCTGTGTIFPARPCRVARSNPARATSRLPPHHMSTNNGISPLHSLRIFIVSVLVEFVCFCCLWVYLFNLNKKMLIDRNNYTNNSTIINCDMSFELCKISLFRNVSATWVSAIELW